MKQTHSIFLSAALLLACALPSQAAKPKAVANRTATSYVNTMIGTGGMGHTFPGACAPFGIVQLSPETDTIPHNVDGKYQAKAYEYCAGYQYDDPTIVGFSHTHLSGTGHSDLGDIMLMPQVGPLRLNPGTAANPDGGYRSRFAHTTEHSRPGYYEVTLADYGIRAQLTATQRVGVHRYTYPKGGDCRLILDMLHGIYNYDGKVLWSSIRVENDTLLTGYRITNGWATCNYTYFAMSLSKPIRSYGYRDMKAPKYRGFTGKLRLHDNFPEMSGRDIVAFLNFDNSRSQELVVKVALSAVSTAGAMRNLNAEAAGKSFDRICAETDRRWNDELGAVSCEGTDDQKAMLYTSLYHTMINPSVYMDVDHQYRGLDGNIHRAEGYTNYTIFSLWDTYRAEHPLLGLFKASRNTDMVRSMLAHQQQSVHHLLPVWSLMGNEGWCMTGYHAVSVVADAIVKGADIDRDDAFRAMVATATCPYYESLADYMRLGYAPYDKYGTAASNTLEYSYDDFALYAAAKAAGRDDVAREFGKRALYYRNTFDTSVGFASPRTTDGRFKADLDPYQTYGEGFIEGNSWNFSFSAPQDVNGLIALFGGDGRFVAKLDQLFDMDLPAKYYKDNEDITADCLVGGYVHGNEPSHHIPYLYAWTSAPWKTQRWMRTIMNRMYRNDIRGLGGNDDCGQMSAWYVFSAMGFYPVCPSTDQYVLGAPYMPYIDMRLENGNHIIVKAPGVSDRNRYVQSVRINGKPYQKLYVTHSMLTAGATIEFRMGSKPNLTRGLAPEDKPFSMTKAAADGSSIAGGLRETKQQQVAARRWRAFSIPEIKFEDKAPASHGSQIYHSLVANPDAYINKVAREVLNTLYRPGKDSIPAIHQLHYTLEDTDGISAKDGSGGYVTIFYSTRHIERSFAGNDTARVDFETRGVLLHELTHAFQLEPQGIGDYGSNRTFWAFIEGMADAVRVANDGFHGEADRPKGGSYRDGYRKTGYFLAWIQRTKDKDFLRKFNRTAIEVVPWSWDGAIQHVFGKHCTMDALWHEYQVAMGDIRQ